MVAYFHPVPNATLQVRSSECETNVEYETNFTSLPWIKNDFINKKHD